MLISDTSSPSYVSVSRYRSPSSLCSRMKKLYVYEFVSEFVSVSRYRSPSSLCSRMKKLYVYEFSVGFKV